MKMLEVLKNGSIQKLFIITIFTTIILVNMTFSRYETVSFSKPSVKVALMASDVHINLDIDDSAYPGCEPIIYPIEITNKEDGKICEVTQSFKFKFKRQRTNIPFIYGLYKDENCTQLLTPNEDGYYVDDSYVFPCGVESSKKIYLKIEWSEVNNSSYYAFEIDCFEIDVFCTQLN